ncbi:hypothetical protein [Sphingopyxis sp. NJF-3]
MTEAALQACPICGASVREAPRYPDYVCGDCYQRIADEAGRAIKYHNASPGAPNLIENLTASYADGSPYMSQTCFIDGIACRADEARFGGIVVRPLKKTGPPG